MASAAISDLLRAIDLAGVLANAMLGGVLARRRRLDPVGFVVLAIVSGLGGGLIRDTLLQQGPPFALVNDHYIVTALLGAALAFLVHVEGRLWNQLFPVVDAFAVGCWAAAGAQISLAAGLGWLPVILLGTLTAVGGSIVRDVFVQSIPVVFGGTTLYATCAVVASATMVAFAESGRADAGLMVATAVGGGLTLLARWRGWRLPEAYGWRPKPI